MVIEEAHVLQEIEAVIQNAANQSVAEEEAMIEIN